MDKSLQKHNPNPLISLTGKSEIKAKNPNVTEVTNEPIPDPQGPDEADDPACNPHTNIDNDSRVWQQMLDYIIQTAP